jgi:formylmethanofuran:tetrahydromethanopterin formyltransferase
MEGEFVCEHDTVSVAGAIGCGNLLFLGRSPGGMLQVVEAAVGAAARRGCHSALPWWRRAVRLQSGLSL